MNRDAIFMLLTKVFREVFDDDSVVAQEQLTARDVPAWDSLSNIRMIVTAEEEFGISFSTDEITNLKNVGEFVDVIQRKLSR